MEGSSSKEDSLQQRREKDRARRQSEWEARLKRRRANDGARRSAETAEQKEDGLESKERRIKQEVGKKQRCDRLAGKEDWAAAAQETEDQQEARLQQERGRQQHRRQQGTEEQRESRLQQDNPAGCTGSPHMLSAFSSSYYWGDPERAPPSDVVVLKNLLHLSARTPGVRLTGPTQ